MTSHTQADVLAELKNAGYTSIEQIAAKTAALASQSDKFSAGTKTLTAEDSVFIHLFTS